MSDTDKPLGTPSRRILRAHWRSSRAPGPGACAVFMLAVACSSSSHEAARDAGHDGTAPLPDAGADVKSVPFDAGHVAPGNFDVLTQHNDIGRSGQNLSEVVLNPTNVGDSTFGKLWSLPVDGLIYAQPLIVTQTEIAGAKHNVLIVATMHNSLYAFDADVQGDPLWHVNLGPSVPSTTANIFTANVNIQVEVGILSTPVIDKKNGYIYVARADFTDSKMGVKVHILDLATGKDLPGSPATAAAKVAGVLGPISFDPHYSSQRPSLLLLNDTVYAGFASYGDTYPFYGWILGFTYDGATLKQTQTFISSPGGYGGGFWNSGQGLVSDGKSIYGMTSNGDGSPTADPPSYTEAFLKLSPELAVQDWFVPVSYAAWNSGDIDLGSGGPVLVPGTSPQLIVGGGKDGHLFLVDTTNMGKLGAGDAGDTNVQNFLAVPDGHSIYCAPVIWTGDGTPKLYLWGTGDVVKQFDFHNGLFDPNPTASGTVESPYVPIQDPCGALSISSNGSQASTGIVWAAKPNLNPDHMTVAGTFYAFNALTLAKLWATTDVPARDGFGNYAKFVPPTVANGKVYLATHSKQLVVYGLLSAAK